jgi:hypothetical protein
MKFRIGFGLIGVVVTAAMLYLRVGRLPCLSWGATSEDVDRAMPGDELLVDADLISTRAITIDAPPSDVWPWLVQMGSGKGGVYTYDWIENLFGLHMHSVDVVLPQFQDREVGDTEQLGSKGPIMRVEVLDPEQAMVLRSEDGNWVWSFGIYPSDDGQTRLASRNRIADPGASLLRRAVTTFVMEPGSLIMERKMLLGIKQRAEKLAISRKQQWAA